jgi:hypothetical protein
MRRQGRPSRGAVGRRERMGRAARLRLAATSGHRQPRACHGATIGGHPRPCGREPTRSSGPSVPDQPGGCIRVHDAPFGATVCRRRSELEASGAEQQGALCGSRDGRVGLDVWEGSGVSWRAEGAGARLWGAGASADLGFEEPAFGKPLAGCPRIRDDGPTEPGFRGRLG